MNDLARDRKAAVSQLVGQLSLEWAYLELTIDGCIAILHDFFSGRKIEKSRPRVFSRKIKYISDGSKQLPEMNFIKPYQPILKKLIVLSDCRNWLVHGHLTEINDDKTLKFVRHSMRAKFPSLEEKVFNFDVLNAHIKEIHQLAEVMKELMDTLLALTDHLFEDENA